MTRAIPSSTSTSTSQMWVPKPPSAPSVLSCTPAPIGPPIAGAFAASSASVSGSNCPALGLAGGGGVFFRRLGPHLARRKQPAAAAGQIGEADGRGIADQDRHPPVINA